MTSPKLANVTPSTYESQHCTNGHHEKSSNKSEKGATYKACQGVYKFIWVVVTCTCWCHAMFREAVERAAESIPELEVAHTTIPKQTPGSVDVVPSQHVVTAPRGTEIRGYWTNVLLNENLEPQLFKMIKKLVMKVTGPLEVQVTKLEDGERRPKGSLDVNVEAVCNLSLEGYIPQELTTVNVGMLINALDPPSPGAIQAVFDRWAKAGFCELGTKPVRLLRFTTLVGENGIAGAKKVHAREKENRSKGFF